MCLHRSRQEVSAASLEVPTLSATRRLPTVSANKGVSFWRPSCLLSLGKGATQPSGQGRSSQAQASSWIPGLPGVGGGGGGEFL